VGGADVAVEGSSPSRTRPANTTAQRNNRPRFRIVGLRGQVCWHRAIQAQGVRSAGAPQGHRGHPHEPSTLPRRRRPTGGRDRPANSGRRSRDRTSRGGRRPGSSIAQALGPRTAVDHTQCTRGKHRLGVRVWRTATAAPCKVLSRVLGDLMRHGMARRSLIVDVGVVAEWACTGSPRSTKSRGAG
jgi:hypothetical protein